MHKKIVLIIFSCCFFVQGSNTYGMHPSLQSFLFPGWGQTALNNKNHARTFTFIELKKWLAKKMLVLQCTTTVLILLKR